MANIGSIMNLVKCGLGAVLGTGTKGCRPFLKKVTAISFLSSGFKLDSTRDLNDEYFTELQAEGKLIHIKGIRTFTDNSSDDSIEEMEDGTKQVTKYGLYEFLVNFIEGFYFHSALTSLNSFGDYDVIFWDRDGNGLGTEAVNGSLKGFTVGMIQASRMGWSGDTTLQKEGLSFQLLERGEVDTDYVFIDSANLDFNPNKKDGINEVVLSFPSAPADLATSITIKAVTKQDSKPLSGVLFSQFLVKKGTTPFNPTAGDDSVTPGTYILTVEALATNDALSAQLYNNALNQGVVTLDVDLYKSNTATATVI